MATSHFPGWRGFMLDVSRGKVPQTAEILTLIGQLAQLGYQRLELYVEHTFLFPGKEEAWKDSSPLTVADLRAIGAAARKHQIELVPNCNTFGHMERFLKHPCFQALAECPTPYFQAEFGIYRQGVLYPDEKSLEFVDSLLRDYLKNFDSDKLNVGCDETFELGMGRSKERCDALGKGEVYLEYLLKIYELAKKYHRRMYFWGDIILNHPELIARLPKDVTVLNWGYEAHHPFAEETAKFAASGIPFAVCPGSSTWNSLTGRTANMLGNLASAVTNGTKNGAEGILMTDWGDGGHLQYWSLTYPALAALALACEAGAEALTEDAVAKRINEVFFGDAHAPWGALLLELGHLGDGFHYRRNNTTLFNTILFFDDYQWAPATLDQILPEEIERVEAALNTLQARFQQVCDTTLVSREIGNALRMTRLALTRMRQKKNLSWDTAAACQLLEQTIAEHCALWLARNRVGGMDEGLRRLERVRAEWQQASNK